jgi:hypothetical protein
MMRKSLRDGTRIGSLAMALLGAVVASGCAANAGVGSAEEGATSAEGEALGLVRAKDYVELGPDGRLLGKTSEEWAAEWWRWVYGAHASTHPVLDQTGEFCGVDQHDRAFFLAGSFGQTTSRTCTIPRGKPVFFPLITLAADNCGVPPADQLSRDALIAAEHAFTDAVTSLELDVDGHVVGADKAAFSANLIDVTQFSYVVPPKDNLYQFNGVDFSGRCSPSFVGGYFVMLSLSPGDHELHFASQQNTGFAIDSTYTLHVE